MIRYPNYDRSILSIASSVLNYYGADDCKHSTLKELDNMLKKNYKNVVVMLFDGMGVDAINYHLKEDDFLRKHFVCPISSVFPPTTTAATTSIQSGYSPIEHGWLGWDLYFKELNDNVAIFTNTFQKDGSSAADYHVAQRYIPCKSIFQRIENADRKVKTYYISPFSKPGAESLDEIKNILLKLTKKRGKKYIYVYHPQPDYDMHHFGVKSNEVHNKILQINNTVKDICSKLENTLVIVTADHGLIDSKMDFLEDYPEIFNLLKRPASIEPRALSLFVKDGKQKEFKEKFNSLFGEKYILLTKQEVYDKNIFGYGVPNPRSDGFIGDYIAIAVSDLTLVNYHEEPPFIGAHAGLDEREMLVPFIAIE